MAKADEILLESMAVCGWFYHPTDDVIVVAPSRNTNFSTERLGGEVANISAASRKTHRRH